MSTGIATCRLAAKALQRPRASFNVVKRFGGTRGFVPVDVDHYSSGWKALSDVETYTPTKFQIQTFNKISPKGLERFPEGQYEIKSSEWECKNAHAVLLRSHKLQEGEVDVTVRAIARCGAGTNNVPVPRMTELGIPVFNTPGANANAVKELVLCGMLLGSRRIVDGVNHMKDLGSQGLAKERVEKDKALFGGQEITNKTLAVIGLGHIGAATARDASSLGMNVSGMFSLVSCTPFLQTLALSSVFLTLTLALQDTTLVFL
jgi:D-3-phosphoglycerate dehydrogenase